jgi:hypothetical protein
MYAIGVPTYTISPEALKATKPKAFVSALRIAALLAPLYFLIDWFWPITHNKSSVAWMVLSAVMNAALLAIVITWRTRRQLATYKVFVDDEQIVRRQAIFDQCVRKGTVRTIVERKTGMLVSSKGRVWTFFWGGLWIPRVLPEYGLLKNLVTSWKEPSLQPNH